MEKTGLMTPEEYKRQFEANNELLKRMSSQNMGYEMGEINPNADKKSSSTSKMIINWSYVVFGIVGIIGSFWSRFDMTKYTEFLSTFAYIFAPLVIAVGTGRAFKNYVSKKYNDNSGNTPPM